MRGYSDGVRFAFIGAMIGAVLTIAEAMLAARGDAHYWPRVRFYFFQTGCGIAVIAALIGYSIGARRDARRRKRHLQGLCVRCGYDLRGLTERRCPECGEPF